MDALGADVVNELIEISNYIWENPELGFKEFKACKRLTDFLESQGFLVSREYILKTGFKAEYGSGHPHVLIYSEYDALPGIGHACGHNLIAILGLSTFLLTTHHLREKKLNGKVTIVGSPAEEGGGGKVLMIDAAKDADFALMAHPANLHAIFPVTLSIVEVFANFKGFSCHATRPWNGKNALDCAVLAYNNINALRHSMKPSWRVHGIFSKGGDKPNIVPAEAELWYYVRAPTTSEVNALLHKVENCFKSAATALDCTVEISYGTRYKNVISNRTLGTIYRNYLAASGEPVTDEKTHPISRGSTDFGDVSHVTPGIHPFFYIHTNATAHSIEFNSAANTTQALTSTFNVATCLTKTIVDVFSDSSLLDDIKRDFADQLQEEA